MEQLVVEDPTLLRTVQNYDADLMLGDVKKTGLEKKCAFNEIPSFHVTNNLSLDMMHDYLEGVCSYVMTEKKNSSVLKNSRLIV